MVDPAGYLALLPPPSASPTDIYIMSHGWNNSAAEAESSYQSMAGLIKEVAGNTRPNGYKELLIGVRWPSKAWIPADDNEEAAIAKNSLEKGRGESAGRSIDPRIVAALYENLPCSKATEAQHSRDIIRLQQLLVKTEANHDDFKELFSIFRRYDLGSDFPEDENVFNSDRVTEAALSRQVANGRLEGGFTPLDIARVATYYQMKARAGLVGRSGVRSMIANLQTRFPTTRVHLFGHSFGCKVMLAAVGERDLAPPRAVTTLVLIQGAVSLEALADRVTDTNQPGGYHSALMPSRVSGPIIVTFSSRDRALNNYYPIASRFRGQFGELEAAQASKFSALGAFGAFGAGSDLLSMKVNGDPYTFTSKVTSVDGGMSDDFIADHSKIFNPNVAWLLWSAVKSSF